MRGFAFIDDGQVQCRCMEDTLYSSIVRTLTFFDIFDHPLTDRELFEYLYYPMERRKLDFQEFFLQTRNVVSDSRIGYTEGLWHLKGRESILATHTERSVSTSLKLNVLTRTMRLAPYLPFVRAIFVCNTFAFNAADHDSDIDVLIVVKSGHMWTARIMTTIIFSLFGLRRTHTKIKNRICLSFYLADRSLNIFKFKISNDVYLSYWLWTLIPVYDPDSLRESMIRANRELVAPFESRIRSVESTLSIPCDKRASKSFFARVIENIFAHERGVWLENIVRSPQRKKIMRNTKSLVHAKDTRVVVNDSVLKFHENDRRVLYRDLWQKKLAEFGILEKE